MAQLQDPSAIFARIRPNRSDMDSFNQLVDTAADHLEGHSDVSEVQAQLAKVDQDLGHLRLQFEDGLRFQVRSPELDSGVALAYNAFRNLAQEFPKLEQALQAGRGYDLARLLESCNATVNQLFWAFQDLREMLAQETYSEAPFIQELVRVGKAWVQNRLAPELFQERFQAFCEFHDGFLESLQPLLAEVEGDPRQQQLLDALDEQNIVLDEISTTFQAGDRQQLDRALHRLCNSSTVLLELQQEFQKETQTSGLLCFRCGHANDHGEKTCTNCQSRLVDLQSQEGGSYQDAALPPHLSKLVAAGEGFRDGSLDREAFLEILDWYDGLNQQAHQQLDALAAPQQENEDYEDALEAMEQALHEFKTAVGRLRDYANRKDPVDLESGLEGCLAGHRSMLRFAEINESLKAKS
jgi:hypothetical protein